MSINWQRHIDSGDTRFHAIVEMRADSTVTHCRGRWATGEHVEAWDAPPVADRCHRCVLVVELHDRFDLGGEAGEA